MKKKQQSLDKLFTTAVGKIIICAWSDFFLLFERSNLISSRFPAFQLHPSFTENTQDIKGTTVDNQSVS